MTEPPDHNPDHARLDELSAAALDRYFESPSVLPPGSVSSSSHDARLAHLLSLLELPIERSSPRESQRLIDLTAARLGRAGSIDLAGRIGQPQELGPRLAPADAAALDHAVGSGWSVAGQASTPLASLLSPLDAVPAFSSGDRARLIEATLARVDAQIDSSAMRMRLSDDDFLVRPRLRTRLWDVLAACVAVGVATMIVAPMIANARAITRETVCADNLGRASLGFTLFAGDHDGSLPRVEALGHARPVRGLIAGQVPAISPQQPLASAGSASSPHSANLYTLVRGGYVSISDLACPGNESAATAAPQDATNWQRPEHVSYAFQLFTPGTEPRWFTGRTQLILSDRSPARAGRSFSPVQLSPNHVSRGQNAMFNDGSVRFLTTPVLDSGDNMWLPRRLEQVAAPKLDGTERPESESDAFVAQ